MLRQLRNKADSYGWALVEAVLSQRHPPALKLNRYQESFCRWVAFNLSISPEEGRERFRRSWWAVRGGHSGRLYRIYSHISHELFQVFASDSPGEVYEAYCLHDRMHLLRMLSYPEPEWPADHPIVAGHPDAPVIGIVDYGCGLAQKSISLAEAIQRSGRKAKLYLFDIPNIKQQFLEFFCAEHGIEAEIIPCRAESMPELPPSNVVVAEEFLEHVYNPLDYVSVFDRSIRPGGYLLTAIFDHDPEFMHVHPQLADVRQWIRDHHYAELIPMRLYRKPA